MVRLARGILGTGGYSAVASVGTAREALQALQDVDVVLLDHQLPDASGMEVLDTIRARPQAPAVIMVTAHGNESLAASPQWCPCFCGTHVTLAIAVGPLAGFEPTHDRAYRLVTLASEGRSVTLASLADHVVELPLDPGTFTSDIIEVVGRR
jgi:CheY-like chemotaxis protein